MPEFVVVFKKPNCFCIKINTFEKKFKVDQDTLMSILGEHHFYGHIVNNKNKIIVLTSEDFAVTKGIINYIYQLEGGRYSIIQ
jgi:hypothetical protein